MTTANQVYGFIEKAGRYELETRKILRELCSETKKGLNSWETLGKQFSCNFETGQGFDFRIHTIICTVQKTNVLTKRTVRGWK